jgi:5-methylcytosine-specific restriction endonuclease McrA
MPLEPMHACLDCHRLFRPTRTRRSRCEMCQRARDRRRTAQRRDTGPMTHAAWAAAVKQRDGYRCTVCGRGTDSGTLIEAHHIIPLAQGGRNHPANGRTLCRKCHGKAHRVAQGYA